MVYYICILRGHRLYFQNKCFFFFSEDRFVIANNADTDEMPQLVASSKSSLCLGISSLQKLYSNTEKTKKYQSVCKILVQMRKSLAGRDICFESSLLHSYFTRISKMRDFWTLSSRDRCSWFRIYLDQDIPVCFIATLCSRH